MESVKKKHIMAAINKKVIDKITRSNKKTFLKQYNSTKCNMKVSLLRTGITHNTYINYKNADPKFELAVNEIEMKYDNLVFFKYWELIEKGNWDAIKRYLNRKKFKDSIYGIEENSIDNNKYSFTISKIKDDGDNSKINQ